MLFKQGARGPEKVFYFRKIRSRFTPGSPLRSGFPEFPLKRSLTQMPLRMRKGSDWVLL